MFARIGLGLATVAAATAIMAATAVPADARTSFSFSIGSGGFFPFGGPFYAPSRSYAYAPYYVAPTYAPTVTYGYNWIIMSVMILVGWGVAKIIRRA